jgi:Na+/H+-dicarboxylate symporter/ABC-type amino acid transport substrate-binding protein
MATDATAVRTHANARRRPFSGILQGLVLGIAVGLFVGDRLPLLRVLADAYIKLLQMTVLPFVTGSLIAGLGSLRWSDVQTLGVRLSVLLVVLWLVALATTFLFPLVFPDHQTASFFSTSLLEPPKPFDLVDLYIPANPFHSLANTIMPAVVLFSTLVGIALITVPDKARLLDVLSVINATIAKATAFVVALTPIGVFVIAADAAGTLTLDDLRRVEVYVLSYVAFSLFLSLWVLPGLIAALTPVPYRAIFDRTRHVLLMAFMTSSLLAVLPLLMAEAKGLLLEYARLDTQSEDLPSIIVPASFNFPHVGKVLSLSFVLFGAWFSGSALSGVDYPRLATVGIAVLFGNVNLAIPFLLDLFRIPADVFQLFIATGVVNSHFGTLTAAVHTLTIALLGTCAVAGSLYMSRRKLVRFGIVTAILAAGITGGLHLVFVMAPDRSYDKDKVLSQMEMLRERDTARVFLPDEGAAPRLMRPSGTLLDRIKRRHLLRVGYLEDSLPYAFFNTQKKLVGFDVEMAYQLARDLGVDLEFVPVTRAMFVDGLDPVFCDLVMSGTVVTADRAMRVLFSNAYLDETLAFIVLDHRRADFGRWEQIRASRSLRVGVPRAAYFMNKAQAEIPDTEIVPLDRVDDIFAPHTPAIDAFLATAERGSAYTLLHPEYSVVVPQPRPAKVPLAYAIAGRDQSLAAVVNTWIDLKRKDGTLDELFGHWILGRNTTDQKPRWSILHDVLHWL